MKTPLWTSDDVAAATGGQISGPFAATGVSIDTRTLEPGDLFVAIKGLSFDGHDFVAEAGRRGAAAAIVSRRPEAASEPIMLVPDTERALDGLARAARARGRAKIVAVTGSVGKTNTKEALAQALGRQGKIAMSPGNLNNQWGLPLSLARMAPDAAYGVFELGMNRPGEIAHLAQIAMPHVGVITTIAAVHLENFGSTFDIAEAKAEIFEGMAGSTAVLNRDNAYFPLLACLAAGRRVARILGFGAHPDANVRLEHCTMDAAGSTVAAKLRGRRVDYRLSIPGRPAIINSLAVLAAVSALDADVDQAARALAEFRGLAGRGKRHRVETGGGSFDLVDESYNASPASMRAAIEVLGAMTPPAGGRRIAVLGDMLELGPSARTMHAALADQVAKCAIDLVFTAGPLMTELDRALPTRIRGGHSDCAADLVQLVLAAIKPGDIVTVKGSHGMRMDRVVDALIGAGPAGE